MSQPAADAASEPPTTGDPTVDAITAELGDLDDRPLGEHHDRLARAHERLHGELGRESDPAGG